MTMAIEAAAEPAGHETVVGPRYVLPDHLVAGDVVTDGMGVYRVAGIVLWDTYVRYVEIGHTIAGRDRAGLYRGLLEPLLLLGRPHQEGTTP